MGAAPPRSWEGTSKCDSMKLDSRDAWLFGGKSTVKEQLTLVDILIWITTIKAIAVVCCSCLFIQYVFLFFFLVMSDFWSWFVLVFFFFCCFLSAFIHSLILLMFFDCSLFLFSCFLVFLFLLDDGSSFFILFFSCLLHVCGRGGDVKGVEWIFQLMKHHLIRPKCYDYNSVMTALLKSGNTDQIPKILKEWERKKRNQKPKTKNEKKKKDQKWDPKETKEKPTHFNQKTQTK